MCENKLGKVYSHLEIMNLIDAIPAQYNEKYASSFDFFSEFLIHKTESISTNVYN